MAHPTSLPSTCASNRIFFVEEGTVTRKSSQLANAGIRVLFVAQNSLLKIEMDQPITLNAAFFAGKCQIISPTKHKFTIVNRVLLKASDHQKHGATVLMKVIADLFEKKQSNLHR
jgi:hypothetical protein